MLKGRISSAPGLDWSIRKSQPALGDGVSITVSSRHRAPRWLTCLGIAVRAGPAICHDWGKFAVRNMQGASGFERSEPMDGAANYSSTLARFARLLARLAARQSLSNRAIGVEPFALTRHRRSEKKRKP